MSTEHLHVERAPISVVTISREARRNALHQPLWSALRETFESFARDTPRAIILTGAGGHFCSGMDLGLDNPLFERLVPSVMGRDAAPLEALIRELKEVPNAIARVPCPVIAAIEGACAGGGLEVALACDLRVAAAESFFALPETKVGMMPDVGGSVRAARLLGRARASELVLTGRRFTAGEAQQWGLVNRVTAKGGALEGARALAAEIAACGPTGTRQALEVLRATASLTDADAFEMETRAGVATLLSQECIEGVQAFAQKREPRWS